MGCAMGAVAVVIADALLRESDNTVLVVSLLSFSLSSSSGSTVVQHESSLGLLNMNLLTRLTNKPAQTGTNESVSC